MAMAARMETTPSTCRFTRVAFDEALGEGGTRNQRAVAGAIEEVYEEVLENPGDNPEFAGLVSNIFALGQEGYPLFLDQLAGAEYPQHLQSVLWSTRTINRIVGERMECSGASSPFDIDGGTSAALGDGTSAVPVADAPSEEPMASSGCFDREKVQVWVRGFGSWNELDGDREAPGFDESQYGVIFGADYSFTESWFLGIAGGYFDSNGDFDSWGGRRGASIDYDGLQLAAYGGYDNSVVYARGVLAYGNYDGDSERDIYIPDLVSGRLSGDPSSDVLSFYGEAGYRFDISSGLNLTPYAGVTLARANLDGFTEKDPDGTGAALSVHDSDAEFLCLGAGPQAGWRSGSRIRHVPARTVGGLVARVRRHASEREDGLRRRTAGRLLHGDRLRRVARCAAGERRHALPHRLRHGDRPLLQRLVQRRLHVERRHGALRLQVLRTAALRLT